MAATAMVKTVRAAEYFMVTKKVFLKVKND